ncbi:sugar ABC transporter permease, partial [bacterium]|nr:sugar ABC transporter permease [bacterium]
MMRRAWTQVWVHLLVWLLVLFAAYPVLRIVTISLRPGDQLYSTELSVIPEGATLDAYRQILFEKPFGLWIRNSLIVSLSTAVIGVALASLAGYAFSRFRFRARGAALQGILVTQM